MKARPIIFSLVFPACLLGLFGSADAAELPQPEWVSTHWETAGPPYVGYYGESVEFYSPAAGVASFRLYAKTAQDSGYGPYSPYLLVATFSNLSAVTCTKPGVSGSWELTTCKTNWWRAILSFPKNFKSGGDWSDGQYDYYVTAAGASGNEGLKSNFASKYKAGSVSLVSPLGATASASPVFRLRAKAAWPYPPARDITYRLSLYDEAKLAGGAGSVVHQSTVVFPSDREEVPLSYDGPPLELGKHYAIHVSGMYSFAGEKGTPCGDRCGTEFLAMPTAASAFWIAPAVSQKGVVRLEDGSPREAFIWVWSEGGEFLETRAAGDGQFSLSLARDQRWHIGASAGFGGYLYRSAERIVTTETETPFAELILVKAGRLAGVVSVTKPAKERIVAETEDGVRLTVPALAAAASGDVTVEIQPAFEVPSRQDTRVVGAAYELAVKDAAGKTITAFTKDAELVLPYDALALAAAGESAENLRPAFLDPLSRDWIKLSGYRLDKTARLLYQRKATAVRP